ncbi:MAG TPA: hypothetical protein VE778_01045 [Candidatus Bathyarchaeia archaeon]|jgi:hypothetical protein|nr:hypothetical protein [Candidatus Bathyarchaeia archaeon]
MIDPETKRAWQRWKKETKENAPIMLRGLASSGKRLPSRLYSAGSAPKQKKRGGQMYKTNQQEQNQAGAEIAAKGSALQPHFWERHRVFHQRNAAGNSAKSVKHKEDQ